MRSSQDTMKRLAAIRKLARQMPLDNAYERLVKIADVASGKLGADEVFATNQQTNLAERLEAAIASRAPMAGDPPPETKNPDEEDEKKRRFKGGRDRKESGGLIRSKDLPSEE